MLQSGYSVPSALSLMNLSGLLTWFAVAIMYSGAARLVLFARFVGLTEMMVGFCGVVG